MTLKYDVNKPINENLNELLKSGGYPADVLSDVTFVSVEAHESAEHSTNSKVKLKVTEALKERIVTEAERERADDDGMYITHFFNRRDLVKDMGIAQNKPYNAPAESGTPTLLALVNKALEAKKLNTIYQVANAEDAGLAKAVAFGKVYEVALAIKKKEDAPTEDSDAKFVALADKIWLRVGVNLDERETLSLFKLRFFSPSNDAPSKADLNNEGATNPEWNKTLRLVYLDSRNSFSGTPFNHWVKTDYAENKRTFIESVVSSLGSYVKPLDISSLTSAEDMRDKLNTANQQNGADYTYVTLVDELVNHDATTGDPKWYVQRRDLKEALPEFNARIDSGHVDVAYWAKINRSLATLEGDENNTLVVARENVKTRQQATALLQEMVDFFNQWGWSSVVEEEETSVVHSERSVVKCFAVKESGKVFAKGKVYIVATYAPDVINIGSALNGFSGITQ